MQNNLLKSIVFNRWSAFLHDLIWVAVSLLFAYWFRFNFDAIPKEFMHALRLLICISLPVQGLIFWLFGMYRGLWRFASIPDLIRILKAVFLGALCVTVIISFSTRLVGIPRSVLVLYPLLLIAGLSLPRLCYRWLKERHFSLKKNVGKQIVIIGAGQAGELLLRDVRYQDEFHVVGFIDDDSTKQGREIHGVPIYGGVDDLTKIVDAFGVQEIMIAVPSASQEEMRRIMEYCGTTGLPVFLLPSLTELEGYNVSSSQLRPLTIEDLLGREPVTLDVEAIQAYLHEKVVLVTGGGGSIGSELCRQVARMKPMKLIIFDHGEYNLYTIDYELRHLYPEVSLTIVLGDVKNKERVDWVFRTFSPNVVFHAAAYKHVPMLELNPAEGVLNNVVGTQILVDAAGRYQVERFVQVSTDKAVNPANVMGATKRVGEIYCQNFNEYSDTQFITTRFGNVLGSAGSVVPLFQRQIEEGGPVTVTHPDITRYFMTISEAVSLILQAGSMGQGGEIFVMDMGDSVRISHLAEQMITLSGLKVDIDIEIKYTGLRPGEKLFEEVLHEGEYLQPTRHDKLLLAHCRQVDWGWLIKELEKLEQAAYSRDVTVLKEHLKNIVPEYQAWN